MNALTQAPSKEHVEFAMRQVERCRNYGPELVENEQVIVILGDEIERLEQCHREGWVYASEVEAEYKRRMGHGFGTAHEPPAAPHSDDHLTRFTEWLVKEMPAGTVIGDPAWWARKLLAGACVFADEMPDCEGCAEFVRMQHDIASRLGVDADTDAIDLHGRIYGALSSALPPGPSPLAVYAYAMTERHLSGYRLIIGFDTLTKVQDAHKEVCDLAVLARDAPTKGEG